MLTGFELKIDEENKLNLLFFFHLFVAVFFFFLFLYLSIKLKPTPIRDFAGYWESSKNINLSSKGGILTLLYFPFRAMNFPAYFSALFVNSFCWFLFGYVLWIYKRAEDNFFLQFFSTIFYFLIGFSFAGFSSIVCSEIPHVVLVCFGLRYFFLSFCNKNYQYKTGFLILGLGLSIRTASCYVFFAYILFLSLIFIFFKFYSLSIKKIILSFFCSIIFGFFLHEAFVFNNNSLKSDNFFRYMMYYGLFGNEINSYCGRVNSRVANFVVVPEKDTSIKEVLFKNFYNRAFYILKLMAYKVRLFLSYKYISSMWLKHSSLRTNKNSSSIVLVKRNENIDINVIDKVFFLEKFFFKILKIFFYIVLFFGVFKIVCFWPVLVTLNYVGLISILLFLFFIVFHSIVEIQERYFLPVLIFPFVIFVLLESNSYIKNLN